MKLRLWDLNIVIIKKCLDNPDLDIQADYRTSIR